MWKTVKLGEICDILDKLRKPITKKDRVSGNIPYYGATGVVDWVAEHIFDERLVLVGEDGAKWGSGDKTAFLIEGKSWVNNHAHVLRPHADKVLHEWLAYCLTATDLSPWITGLTVPKLNQAQLRTIPIPLPPLAEQQRIVAKLDAAFAEIEIQAEAFEKKLAHANRIRLKIYQKIIAKHCPTQKKVKLDELVDERCKLSYGIVQPGDEFNGGLPVVRPVDLKGKHIKFDDLKRVNPSKADGYQRTKLIGDEVLLSVRGSTGIVSLATQELAGANVTRGIIPILFNEHTDAEFGYYALQAESVQNQIKAATYGATLQQINVKDVKTLLIDVPPYDEQLAALKEIKLADEQLNLLIEIYTEQLRNSNSLKSAILEKELKPSEAA